MRPYLLVCLMLLAACSGNTGPYKTPTISNSNASSMSDTTLCYRYAGAKRSQALNDEVESRGLDCGAMLEDDPLMR